MDKILEYASSLNWQTMISMFAIGWYFTKDIRDELRKIENDLKDQEKRSDVQFKEQIKRTDKLYEMFIDLLKEGKK